MGLYSSLDNLIITYSSHFGIDLNLKKFVRVYSSLGNMIITNFGYLGTSTSILKPNMFIFYLETTL
jgi:hypothetical protein